MLKSKEKRDTALFVFMTFIIILFLVYLFVPSGDKSSKPDMPSKAADKPLPSHRTADGLSVESKKEEERCDFVVFNLELERELERLLEHVLNSPHPFTDLPVAALEKILAGEGDGLRPEKSGISVERIEKFRELLDKCVRLGFYDLSDISDTDFPNGCSETLRFNVYLACFLISAQREGVAVEILDLPDQVLEKVIDLDMYDIIGDEIEKDIHALPILFFFNLFVQRINLYPTRDEYPFFHQRLADIRDLSRKKICNRIKEFVHFSQEIHSYRIGWREGDTLNPDDQQTYAGLSVRTFDFLKQRYLVFPDEKKSENNRWIRDLCEADTGDIELVSLLIYLDEPAATGMARKIYYDPQRSRVVVVLKACNFEAKNETVRRLIARRAESFHSRLAAVDLLNVSDRKETFEGELLRLGHYLKGSIYPLLGAEDR